MARQRDEIESRSGAINPIGIEQNGCAKNAMRSQILISKLRACIQTPPGYSMQSAVRGKGAVANETDRFMPAANDLRKGMAILYNGDVAVVLDAQHRTPGNLRAFVQATIRSIKSGKSSDVRFSSTEKVEVVPMTTRKMDFSYKDGDDFVFSDPETFETVTLAAELVGEAKNYLVENAPVTVTFVEDKAVSIELPASVVLKVSDAQEGIRGDSANNVQKPVRLETGITIQAPLFIKTGERVKIDTRSGKYMERA